MAYFLGRGPVYIGDYQAGVLKAVQKFHCPSFEVEVSAEYAEHKNSNGTVRVRDAKVATEQMGKINFTLDEADPNILAMVLGGSVTTDAGTSFSAKAFPTVSLTSPIVPVPGNFTNLASLTITDSAGTPATLSLGTHYTVDLDNGLVTFLNLASFTQPFKAAGATTAAKKQISIATQTSIEKAIRFAGINIADGTNAIVQIYRVQIPPTKFPVKTDGNDFVKFEFAGDLLADLSAPFSEAFGQYGFIETFA